MSDQRQLQHLAWLLQQAELELDRRQARIDALLNRIAAYEHAQHFPQVTTQAPRKADGPTI